jgi:hypothetical protein
VFGLTPLSALVHKMGRETKEGRRRDKQRKSAKMSNEQVKWGNRCRSKTKKRPSPQVSAPKLQRLKQPSTGVSSGLVNSTVASAILVKWVSMTYAGCFNFDDARVIRAKYSRLVYVLHRVAQGDVPNCFTIWTYAHIFKHRSPLARAQGPAGAAGLLPRGFAAPGSGPVGTRILGRLHPLRTPMNCTSDFGLTTAPEATSPERTGNPVGARQAAANSASSSTRTAVPDEGFRTGRNGLLQHACLHEL